MLVCAIMASGEGQTSPASARLKAGHPDRDTVPWEVSLVSARVCHAVSQFTHTPTSLGRAMPALAKKRPCAISCFAGASLGAVSFWTSSFLVDRGSRTFSLWRSSDQNKTTWPNPADQGRKTKPMSSQARASTAPAVASRMKCASSSALQLQALGLSNTEHHGPQP